VIALRGDGDGGEIADYRSVGRRAPWVAGAFTLAFAGLAGLPPGLAGLFAKVTVVRALLAGGAGWLAVIVALNAVVGLAYYVRVVATLFALAPSDAHGAAAARRFPVPWPVAVGLAALTLAGLVAGLAPQLVLDAAGAAAGH
jgi:NADH-quinone oxidoreductase subunit N